MTKPPFLPGYNGRGVWLRETQRYGRYARCLILEVAALIGVAAIDRFTD